MLLVVRGKTLHTSTIIILLLTGFYQHYGKPQLILQRAFIKQLNSIISINAANKVHHYGKSLIIYPIFKKKTQVKRRRVFEKPKHLLLS